ncbi:MAG: hypothetical protein BMS9Abin37_2474 [Acidobacteriota bacterium]|nr:MAG: hypothetical protein BMS9Abin37_2474 [Acidobacteriota bacterium]
MTLAETRPELERLTSTLDGFLSDYRTLSLRDLQGRMNGIEGALDTLPDFVHCLSELEALPAPVSSAFRRLELEPLRIEAAVGDRAIEDAYRIDRAVSRFDGNVRAHHVRKLEKLDEELQEINGAVVRERVRNRFLEHFKIASLPAAQLTSEQKKFKSLYNRGRRELEHEFGKTMRFKAIRELVSGESGRLVRDLSARRCPPPSALFRAPGSPRDPSASHGWRRC